MIQMIPNHCLKRGSSRQFPNKKRQSESQIKCSQTSVTKINLNLIEFYSGLIKNTFTNRVNDQSGGWTFDDRNSNY